MTLTQADDYVAWEVARCTGPSRWVYDNSGSRCTNPHGGDCSSLQCRALKAVGVPFPCLDTDGMIAAMKAAGTLVTRDVARARAGYWAVRPKGLKEFDREGHAVCSLGDKSPFGPGRTAEAHSHADGCYIGYFDGNRGFEYYGRPPGLNFGIVIPPGPPPPPPKPVPPQQAPTVPAGDDVNKTDINGIHLDSHGNGVVDVKNVSFVDVVGITVIGGSDPLHVTRYDDVPTARLINGENKGVARVVITDGAPLGTYSLRVASV